MILFRVVFLSDNSPIFPRISHGIDSRDEFKRVNYLLGLGDSAQLSQNLNT